MTLSKWDFDLKLVYFNRRKQFDLILRAQKLKKLSYLWENLCKSFNDSFADFTMF